MRGYQNILYIHLIPGTQITEETYREMDRKSHSCIEKKNLGKGKNRASLWP